MSKEFELKLSPKSQKYLNKMPELAREGAYKGLKRAMLDVESHSVAHFTDKGLHVRSGLLRNSINSKVLKKDKDTLLGVLGANTPYAAIHELGGTISHSNLFGRGISAQINMPRREYLEPAIINNLRNIIDAVSDSIVKEVEMR